jgi:hypothetical protein
MRILFDQGTPLPLRAWLAAHQVETARQHGWSKLRNGELLAAAIARATTIPRVTRQLDLRALLGEPASRRPKIRQVPEQQQLN